MSSANLAQFVPRKYFANRVHTEEELLQLAQQHSINQFVYTRLDNYYKGKHDIFFRTFPEDDKPNNQLVNNFAKIIVDDSTSYFMGNPVTYFVKDNEEFHGLLVDWLDYNFEDDVNSELASMVGKFGHAFEIHWIDEITGKHRFKHLSPQYCMVIYSNDIEERMLAAVTSLKRRDVLTREEYIEYTLYTDTSVITYEQPAGDNGSLTRVSEVEHFFGQVPVIEYVANEDRIGDFEPVISLIDAYNLATSESMNEIEYWNDAYLLLKNLNATENEAIQDMKRNRVMLVDGDGDAKFLTKDINDYHVQNVKDRLTADIHKFSKTPNLSDEQFASNLSGVAIRYKMLGLETKTAIKERKFYAAFMKRIQLFKTILSLKGKDFMDVSVTPIFTRNLPHNLVEVADMAVKVRGIISDETLRGQFPFITDMEEERKLVEAQVQQEMRNQLKMDFSTGFGSRNVQGSVANQQEEAKLNEPPEQVQG